jgi:putative transposase
MRVMFDVTDPVERMHTMTKREGRAETIDLKALLAADGDFLRPLVERLAQEILELEMSEAVGAQKGERTAGRLGYRSGYYGRSLTTRVGTLELRVPQDRQGRFSTVLFERYQRSEKALVGALAEMYVQGVSTRKVKAITEELCGHEFSASAISAINKSLDEALKAFAERRLSEVYAYLILDARYERVREGGVIASQAVLVAIGVDWEGRRQVLAVDLASRESRSSWKDFLLSLKARGLHGVEFVVSDDHPGLKAAIREVLPEAIWQRCYVHFLRNALDYVPRKVDDDCLQELRWFYDRRDLGEVRRYRPVAGQVADQVPQALRLGRGQRRGDAELLPAAARPPQAHEVDQHAGAAQPGDQAAHPCGADLSQCRELSKAGARPRRRDP